LACLLLCELSKRFYRGAPAFLRVGRGWGAGVGVNDVLAHLPFSLDKRLCNMV
jgi:hypothetical protein